MSALPLTWHSLSISGSRVGPRSPIFTAILQATLFFRWMGVVHGPSACVWDLLCLIGSIPDGEHQLTQLVSGCLEGLCGAAICRDDFIRAVSIDLFTAPKWAFSMET